MYYVPINSIHTQTDADNLQCITFQWVKYEAPAELGTLIDANFY